MSLVLVTPPALDPVSLAEAKAHARISSTDEDGLIAGYILAARQWAETFTQRKLVTQTWDWSLDQFPACLEPPIGPVQSVASVKYIDTAGAQQTLAPSEYQVDASSHVARIVPAYGKSWPSTRLQLNAVTVRLAVGYGSGPGDMPEPVRQAILLLIGHFYENRETVTAGTTVSELPLGARALLIPHRVFYGGVQ